MSTNYLVEVLSQFDINFKYFKICVKNQLNRKYGQFYWFLCFVSLSLLSYNTFILVFISDEDIDSLKKYGSVGFKLAGISSRLMLDIIYLVNNILELVKFNFSYFITFYKIAQDNQFKFVDQKTQFIE